MLEGIAGLESWTEDLWFCQRIADTKKWKVYADSSLLCTHYDMTTCKPYNLPVDSKPVQHMRRSGKKIVDLGSGYMPYQTDEGTPIRVDDERYQPDYRCDLHKLPFDNKAFDVVFSPALERFPIQEAPEILSEWTRIIKSGGELRLVVSDMKHIAKEIAEDRAEPDVLNNSKRLSAFSLKSLEGLLHPMTVEKVFSDPAHIAVRAKVA